MYRQIESEGEQRSETGSDVEEEYQGMPLHDAHALLPMHTCTAYAYLFFMLHAKAHTRCSLSLE